MVAYRMPVADRIAACLPTELAAARPAGLLDLAADTVPGRASADAVRAAREALDAGETHYTDRPGIGPLRAGLAEEVGARHGLPLRPENVVVSSGALEGAFAAVWVGLFGKERAALLLPDPANPALPRLGCLAGGAVRRLTTSAEDGFRLRATEVERGIGEGAQLLLIGSPDATTGAALAPADLAQIGELAERHDLTVVLDESLWRLVSDGAATATLRDAPSLAGRTVVIGSFSHDAGLSAWRVGYFAASNEAFARMRSLKQALSICSPSVSQYAALGSLAGLSDGAAARREELARRLAAFAEPLEQAGLRVVRPEVPVFAWVDAASAGVDEAAAVGRLRQAGIAARPGSELGEAAAGWLRFTLALPPDGMADAARTVVGALGRDGA